MNARRLGRSRWPARLAVLSGLVIVALAVVAPPAGANYGRVSARVGCDRVVHWEASASTEGGAQARTNARVLVEYRPTSADQPLGDWRAAGTEGRFDEDNGFRFSGSFRLPDQADSVDLRVVPMQDWGDGAAAGGPRFARSELPEGCEEHPIAVDLREDCAAGGAAVLVTNLGDQPDAVTVSADGVALRELQVAGGANADLLVPLLEGRPTTLRVAAADFVVVETTMRASCGVAGPAAIVLERCPSRQAVMHATLGAAHSGVLQLRVDGAIVHRIDLEATVDAQRTLELGDAGALPIEVTIDGTTVASAPVGGCDQPAAGAITCGVAGRAACDDPAGEAALPPPPPPPPPTSIEFDDPALPRTGPWERAIALGLGGSLLLAGGMAFAARDRRAPVTSLLADSVATYRQQWWDGH